MGRDIIRIPFHPQGQAAKVEKNTIIRYHFSFWLVLGSLVYDLKGTFHQSHLSLYYMYLNHVPGSLKINKQTSFVLAIVIVYDMTHGRWERSCRLKLKPTSR